ncbi:MAG: hypothetical protein K0S32_3058 [Bacteroidetes bacterium]|jgi:hypothetical protein|nr:hypothetical protein [Bacteroidota bacterium]
MKNLILILLTCLSISVFAQKKKNLPETFYTCWAAAYEEDDQKANTKVYRQCDFKNFKPSFYRQRFVFKKDGTCQVLMIGETDAHYFLDCKWTYNKKKGLVAITETTKKLEIVFQVLSSDAEVLKVKMLK